MLLATAALLAGCAERAPVPPNVLFVVWDTVRADRLSLYGHDAATTPFLAEFARDARVFDDCVSTASWTVPSHAALFTGRMPTESATHLVGDRLPAEHATLAERFAASGYATFMYSANPHIARETGFGRGFDVIEHPWDDERRGAAEAIVRAKVGTDDASERTLGARAFGRCRGLGRQGVGRARRRRARSGSTPASRAARGSPSSTTWRRTVRCFRRTRRASAS
ncbi:MAG: sulfatase-like hydrolase/transferase [Planctomycetota bacterium]